MLYIYIPMCLCEPLSFLGGGREKRGKGPFFLDTIPQKE